MGQLKSKLQKAMKNYKNDTLSEKGYFKVSKGVYGEVQGTELQLKL